ncbi:MAG: hypothetical protein MUE41_18305, partial [Gemmatimonadaceae bacterium]|nr:hypothetical protein [Gemmatimonadaceae bacterium]
MLLEFQRDAKRAKVTIEGENDFKSLQEHQKKVAHFCRDLSVDVRGARRTLTQMAVEVGLGSGFERYADELAEASATLD